jgi:hypothetical protein
MQSIADEHVAAYHQRTDGWGFGTKKSIENIAKKTHTFLNSGNKDSVGNGTFHIFSILTKEGVIMKLCPLAFFYACSSSSVDKDKMIRDVALLSSMSHDTAISKICSCLFVLLAEKIFRCQKLTNFQ